MSMGKHIYIFLKRGRKRENVGRGIYAVMGKGEAIALETLKYTGNFLHIATQGIC